MPESVPEVIGLRDVSVVRDGRALLDGVTWTVTADQHWVVLGPNGAGKTTLMQVAASYLAPTRGEVRLFGAVRGSVDVRPLRRRIGYAGTAPAGLVHTELPALEIVVTGKHAAFVDSRWHEYTEADWERARRLLADLHAAALAERRFGTLSAGERQRVLIARSLMAEPRLLILDEATTGLDLGARERLVSSLARLAANPDGPPMVLVTHHVEEIPAHFDHALLLRSGAVVAAGPIDQILTSEAVSHTFDAPLRLWRDGGRHRAEATW